MRHCSIQSNDSIPHVQKPFAPTLPLELAQPTMETAQSVTHPVPVLFLKYKENWTHSYFGG